MFPYIPLGDLHLPTYYLLISIGAVAGLMWFMRRTPPAYHRTAVDLALVGLLGGLVGARALHIFLKPHRFMLIIPSKFSPYGAAVLFITAG